MTTGSIGFIGLGNIGRPMAERLIDRGYRLVGHDISADAMAAMAAREGFTAARNAGDVVRQVETLIISVPASSDVEQILVGQGGVLDVGNTVRHVVDTGTSIPESTRKLSARLAGQGVALIDAPVSGGLKRARDGDLTLMVGGADVDVEAVRPLLDALGSTVMHFGPSGAGHVAKLVNNLILGVNMAVIAEALVLGASAGLDPKALVDMVKKSTGASQVLDARAWRLLSGEYEPAQGSLNIMCKDFIGVLTLAQQLKVSVPLGSAAAELYKIGVGLEHGCKDYAAVGLVYEHLVNRSILSGGDDE